MEEKLNYSVRVWFRGNRPDGPGWLATQEGKQYTRSRADRILSDMRHEHDAVRAELWLDGTLLRWWSQDSDWKIVGENLPRRKQA